MMIMWDNGRSFSGSALRVVTKLYAASWPRARQYSGKAFNGPALCGRDPRAGVGPGDYNIRRNLQF